MKPEFYEDEVIEGFYVPSMIKKAWGAQMDVLAETDRICRGIELDPKFVDCIVKRYIEWNGGRYDDVYVMRDGQKLMFDEVAVFEPEEAE